MIKYKIFIFVLFNFFLNINGNSPDGLDPELINDIFGSSSGGQQETRYNGGNLGGNEWQKSCHFDDNPNEALCHNHGECVFNSAKQTGYCECQPGYIGHLCHIDESTLDSACYDTEECVKCFVFGIADGNSQNLAECLQQRCKYELKYEEYDGAMDAFDSSYKLCKIEQDDCSMEYLATHTLLGLPIYVPKNPHCKSVDETERSLENLGKYVGLESSTCDGTSDGYGGLSSHEPKPHGAGYLEYAENDSYNRKSYRGQFNCGERQGNGVLDWKDGASFWGEFTNGVRNSSGVMIYANGDIYNGNWTNDVKNGYGIYISKSKKATYYGYFVDGKKEGRGSINYQNTYVINGIFENDVLTEGEIILPNGDKYSGAIKQGKKNLVNGAGKYIEDCSGNIYEGNFIDGVFEGAGKYGNNDGDIYNGSWLNGKPHGSGIYTDKTTGNTYEGVFDHGKMMKREEDCLVEIDGMYKYVECPPQGNVGY